MEQIEMRDIVESIEVTPRQPSTSDRSSSQAGDSVPSPQPPDINLRDIVKSLEQSTSGIGSLREYLDACIHDFNPFGPKRLQVSRGHRLFYIHDLLLSLVSQPQDSTVAVDEFESKAQMSTFGQMLTQFVARLSPENKPTFSIW
jgi:hypothetical protein